MTTPSATAAQLSEAQRNVLFVSGPWLASQSHLTSAEVDELIRKGLIESTFPQAQPGDSGLQFWRTSALGLAALNHLKEQTNG